VDKEKAGAKIEQDKVSVINTEVSAKAASCQKDLAAAEPALAAAEAALNTLNKTNLSELKSFGSPPEICVTVVAACMCLMAKGKVPKDRSWKAGKIFMGDVNAFLNDLITYDKENIPDANLKECKKYLKLDDFDGEIVSKKSLACGGLCNWVVNIVIFYEVFCDVAPKRAALAEAEAQLKSAQDKLGKIMAQIDKLDAALGKLQAEFQEVSEPLPRLPPFRLRTAPHTAACVRACVCACVRVWNALASAQQVDTTRPVPSNTPGCFGADHCSSPALHHCRC
jgi:dynein heavy chain